MVASHKTDCKGEDAGGLDRPANGERTCKREGADESAVFGRWGRMRRLLNRLSLMVSAVVLVSCASTIPPGRIGEYVSAEHQVGGDVFTRIIQRPLQAGLVVVSDTGERGAAPNLPEEGLVRLGESLRGTSAMRFLWP